METSVRTDERLSMETENISIDPYENDPVVLGYRSLGEGFGIHGYNAFCEFGRKHA